MIRAVATLLMVMMLFLGPAQAAPILVQHEFHAQEGGGFALKTWKELGSDEARYIISGACYLAGADCSKQAGAIQQLAIVTREIYDGGSYRTTATITSHDGEEYRGYFAVEPGYTICKAQVDTALGSIGGGSTFNLSIERAEGAPDGVGLYAVVPKNRGAGQSAEFRLVLMEVLPGEVEKYGCWPHKTLFLLCSGSQVQNSCLSPTGTTFPEWHVAASTPLYIPEDNEIPLPENAFLQLFNFPDLRHVTIENRSNGDLEVYENCGGCGAPGDVDGPGGKLLANQKLTLTLNGGPTTVRFLNTGGTGILVYHLADY